MDTAILQVNVESIEAETPTEMLLEAGDRIAVLKQLVKDVERLWEQKMIERIEATGPIQDGDWLYRVGNPSVTKCNDVPATLEAILTHVDGDFTRLCEHLASGAIKHGSAKQTLAPEEFERLFTVTRESELQKDEATPRRLAKVNLAFVRPARVKELA